MEQIVKRLPLREMGSYLREKGNVRTCSELLWMHRLTGVLLLLGLGYISYKNYHGKALSYIDLT